MTDEPKKAWWRQFSIRDLLLWVLVCSLSAGWWTDHRRLTKLADPWIVILETDHGFAYYAVSKLEEAGIEVACDVSREVQPTGRIRMQYVCSVRVRASDYERAHRELDAFWRDAFVKRPSVQLLKEPLKRNAQ